MARTAVQSNFAPSAVQSSRGLCESRHSSSARTYLTHAWRGGREAAMNARYVRAGGPEEVKKKEEEGLITLMKERAVVRCRQSQKDYYECVKDRTISVVWACREQANAMNECLHQHTTDEVLADLKTRWVKAGKPSIADRANLPKF